MVAFSFPFIFPSSCLYSSCLLFIYVPSHWGFLMYSRFSWLVFCIPIPFHTCTAFLLTSTLSSLFDTLIHTLFVSTLPSFIICFISPHRFPYLVLYIYTVCTPRDAAVTSFILYILYFLASVALFPLPKTPPSFYMFIYILLPPPQSPLRCYAFFFFLTFTFQILFTSRAFFFFHFCKLIINYTFPCPLLYLRWFFFFFNAASCI